MNCGELSRLLKDGHNFDRDPTCRKFPASPFIRCWSSVFQCLASQSFARTLGRRPCQIRKLEPHQNPARNLFSRLPSRRARSLSLNKTPHLIRLHPLSCGLCPDDSSCSETRVHAHHAPVFFSVVQTAVQCPPASVRHKWDGHDCTGRNTAWPPSGEAARSFHHR